MIVSADAAAKLLLELSLVDAELAEHSIATARWSGAIARSLDLEDAAVIEATMVGALHEIGFLRIPGARAAFADILSGAAPHQWHRTLRNATVEVIAADADLRRFAEATGTLFDDIGHSPGVRCAIVADQFESLVRHLPGMGTLRQRDAIDVLQNVAGARFHRATLDALISVVRRSSLRAVRPA